jgi:hypothetical protein
MAQKKSLEALVQRNPIHLYQVSHCTKCLGNNTLGTLKCVQSAHYVPSVQGKTIGREEYVLSFISLPECRHKNTLYTFSFLPRVLFLPSVVGMEHTVKYEARVPTAMTLN